MNLVTPIKSGIIIPAILAMGVVLPFQAQASDSDARIKAEMDIKPLVTLTSEESKALSLAAGRILLHVDNARMEMTNKDKTAALNEIEQGLTLVKVVSKALPKYKISTSIMGDGVEYNADEVVSDRYVPVFNEQYIEDVVAPVVQAKKGKSHGYHSKSQGNLPYYEDFAVWRQSTMKLDIVLAGNTLALAKDELNKGNQDNADVALAVLQTEAVVFEFIEAELPLTEAADELKLAQLEVKQGNVVQAQETLKRASEDLKVYEELAGDTRAREVRNLKNEIDDMAKSLDKDGHSEDALKKAGKKIASYWDRVVNWFK